MSDNLFLPEEAADTWAKIQVSDETLNSIKARGWATFIDEIVYVKITKAIEAQQIDGTTGTIPEGVEAHIEDTSKGPHGYQFTVVYNDGTNWLRASVDERHLYGEKYPFIVTQVLDPD